MPELPEVETVVRDLRPLLVGRRFTGVWAGPLALRKPWMRGWGRRLTGRPVEAIRRRGKWIVAEMEGGDRLVIHLGMTGQLTVAPAEAPTKPHTHLVFDLDEGAGQLRFRDVRRFGSATLFRADEDVEAFFRAAGLGPEPFGLDAAYWRERLAATARCLKAVLLDQRVVAGVGNIYADEALFEARLHPAGRVRTGRAGRRPAAAGRGNRPEPGHRTPRFEHPRLRRRRRPERRDASGVPRLRPHRRAVPALRRPIERMRLAGRSTHFCPACQTSVRWV